MRPTTLGHSALLAAAVLVLTSTSSRADVSPSDDPQESYDLNYIGFEEYAVIAVGRYGAAAAGTWSQPFLGKYRRPLEGAAFYEQVGRADLVQAYSARMTTKVTLLVGGGVGLLGGTLWMLSPLIFSPPGRADFSSALWIGGGIALASLIPFYVGVYLNPHPVEPAEARELADTYNKSLKKRLGLARSPSLAVVPFVTPEVKGLGLIARF